jgi:hypothetical protein
VGQSRRAIATAGLFLALSLATACTQAGHPVPGSPTDLNELLLSTRWHSVETFGGNLDITFVAGGDFHYVNSPSGVNRVSTPGNESWALSNGRLTVCFNDCYAKFDGQWNGIAFVGRKSNLTRRTWDVTLSPVDAAS